jgi:hypothetical protein
VPEVKETSAATFLGVFSVPADVFTCFQASTDDVIIG